MAQDGKIIIGTKVDESGLKSGIAHVESSLKSVQGTLAKLGIGAGIGVGLKKVASEFTNFETTLKGASTLFGSVEVDVDNLSKGILQLSNDTGITATSFNEGLYQALSAGVPVTEDMGVAMGFLGDSSKLAKAGFTEMPIAIEATAKTLNAYGMEVSEASHIQDILIQTQNLGITTVDELGRTLANVTPIASSFGVSFEQIGASLALITAKGTPTSVATTQLRQVIAELGKDGTEASKALASVAKSAGLPSTKFKELMASGYDLGQILELMQGEAEKSGLSILDMFSSIEAGQAALAITSDLEKFNSNLDAMKNSAGSVQTAYEAMSDSVRTETDKLKTRLSTIAINIGNSLKEPFKNGLQAMNIMLDGIIKYFPAIEIGFKALGSIATVVVEALKTKVAGLKGELDKFLDFTGLDAVIDIALKPVGDLWDNLRMFGETGQLSYLISGAKDVIAIGIELYAGAEAFSALMAKINSGLGLVGGTALAAGVLSIGIAFYEAQQEGDWAKFGEDLVAGIIAGLAVGGLTANVQAGVLTATLVLNLEIGSKIADFFKNKNTVTEVERSEFAKDAEIYRAIVTDRYSTNIQKLKNMAAVDSVTIGNYLAKGFGLGLKDLDNISEERAKGIVRAFEKELEIHSPSKKAERLGEFFVQGFLNGTIPLEEAVAGIVTEAMSEAKDAVENGTNELSEGIGELVEQIDGLGGEIEETGDKATKLTQAMAESIGGSMVDAISASAEALAGGEDAFKAFARTGLLALASLLEGYAETLAAQALMEKNFQKGAGAVAAAAGAGLIRGYAGQFATGGIVNGPYDGTDNLIASVKAGEVILNHAQAQNTAKLLNRMEQGAGGAVAINFYGDVYGDKEEIATTVYDKIKVLQREGRLAEW